MGNNIQIGDVVEWDMVTRVNQVTYKRIAEHGPGPFVVRAIDRIITPGDGVSLENSLQPSNSVFAWRFKVNHFLTAVRRAKLSATV
jgi:hypothetical protein